MGCLSRLVVGLALLVQFLTAVLGMLVLGSAGVLGQAALMSAEDAMIIFIMLGASLVATLVLAIKLWLGSRTRKRLVSELAAAKAERAAASAPPHAGAPPA